MTDDVRKLLGGYATGTLTEAEKQALYEAALRDEELFSALADEQALKELLDDPAARAQVLQATETHVFSAWGLLREWFERPRSKALVGTGAVLVVAIAIGTWREQQQRPQFARVDQPPAFTAMTPPPSQPAQERAASKPPTSKRSPVRPAPHAKPGAPLADESKPEALKQETPVAVAESQPQAVMIAAPPAADSVASIGRLPQPQFSYSLMRRSANGEYQAVSLDAEFSATEEVRIVVEGVRAGVVVLNADDGTRGISSVVEPGKPATFTLSPQARSATLAFTPNSRRLVENTLTITSAAPELRAKMAASEVKRQTAPAQVATEPSVEIKINRK